jgi:ferredoxin
MILSRPKPFEKILASLDGARSVFIVGCGGCPVGCESGGAQELDRLARQIAEKGIRVPGTSMIDFLCNKALVGSRLKRRIEDLRGAERILVMSCGIGVQAVGNMVDLPVLPALDTISAGGLQGLWPSTERCNACGDCVLDRTGGICPFTTCAKKLLNGACGGSNKGKCEVGKDRDCGWYLIYTRLKELGRLDGMKKTIPPRDYRKRDLPDDLRGTTAAALEFEASGRVS